MGHVLPHDEAQMAEEMETDLLPLPDSEEQNGPKSGWQNRSKRTRQNMTYHDVQVGRTLTGIGLWAIYFEHNPM